MIHSYRHELEHDTYNGAVHLRAAQQEQLLDPMRRHMYLDDERMALAQVFAQLTSLQKPTIKSLTP
eukprot:47930-Eustigmatos_ZCMA.PRE.1